ncbi:isocitrate/isopropylmalate dehydrogenase family protein [Terrabacter sp. MAHUQ-38]|uniref:isocitrate/isopropylmalate dehydrogenase family protein n=1 Tax=unclassified Terrabacter TaxID=2630222 RepID=UPI00165DA482|nr:isocitrate/isopropylmalate dehydrogenase family protein [Terrabacter sp. MAHUQ-38]MBC9822526.1 isocitrate/isopropylmalate dehydrogenase family protein [Terrabacter sp. MAHUQ-38]
MRILILPGDGIGPEITAATLRVLEAVDERFGLDLQTDVREIGLSSLAEQGTTLPDDVLELVTEVDGTVLGPVSHYDYPPRAEGGINPSAELRTRFSLHANIRPCRSVADLTVLRTPMDLVIVRENTEGFYSDRNMHAGSGEFMPDEDSAFSIRKITTAASTRVARAAFEIARTRRKHVTAVHKANVLKLSDGLFLREVRKVAEDYPDVELRELIVDAAAARLIRDPGSFDVLVTTNMFGDILSDEASELCGSLGLGGAINAGDDVCVAQAQHGSAPDIAGRGIANPVSLIRSAAMLLDWHGQRSGRDELVAAARAVDDAVCEVVGNPATRTPDLGGTLTTGELAAAVVEAVRRQPAASVPTAAPTPTSTSTPAATTREDSHA